MTDKNPVTQAPTRIALAPPRRAEDPSYLREQLITYIGNKRALLPLIQRGLDRVLERTGRDRLRIFDAFAGSGVVSRFFKRYAESLTTNDIESYAQVLGACYLTNRSEIDLDALRNSHAYILDQLDDLPVRDGFIRRLYSPKNDTDIRPGERAFYTNDNAMRIDSLRWLIDRVPVEHRVFFLGPLLSAASVHANTSGVFKGFYKDRATGIGQFGGSNRDALTRIMGRVALPLPVLSRFDCDVKTYRGDANDVVRAIDPIDLAYFDPPYNQHPYGSNYFMLNLIVANREPDEVSPVSGIPVDWQRSAYNRPRAALGALTDLVENTPADFLLISYNNEGFINRDDFVRLLRLHGRVEVIERPYNAFRGSRNLRNRPRYVTEQLFLLERR